MKYALSLLVLAFTFNSLSISAQQSHFLYFQTEGKQLFYVKLDNKIFSSSESGYLIVPKLSEDNYRITFGFAKNEWPEQVINYKLDKDAGLLLKNFGEKGWGVFNLQSSNITMAGNREDDNVKNEQAVNNDNFSNMLANVVNDSTIKQKDVVSKEETKQPPVVAASEQSVAVTQDTTSHQDIAKDVNETAVSASVITKKLQKKGKGGMEMVYYDEYNNIKDTIRIFIPSDKNPEPVKTKSSDEILPVNFDSVKSANTTNDNVKSKIQEEVAHTSTDTVRDTVAYVAPINFSVQQHSDSSVIVSKKEDKMEFLPLKSGAINSNCTVYATEEDFLKLRKKMAAENSDEDMTKVAKKAFKTKCFTTQEIKNLAALFLKDEGKYNFFDTAYPYVSDSNIFYTLQDQLSDEYFIKRFKAMIHQ